MNNHSGPLQKADKLASILRLFEDGEPHHPVGLGESRLEGDVEAPFNLMHQLEEMGYLGMVSEPRFRVRWIITDRGKKLLETGKADRMDFEPCKP